MKVLVANRGEIALRVLRTCSELGYPGVAVYSEADQNAAHVRYADQAVCIGPAPAAESYLNIEAILDAARQTGAEAIHPGYGFLSENAAFAQAVEDAGMIFIGPRPETVALTGDKLAARRIAREAGLPVLPGPDLPIDESLPSDLAGQVTFPVLIKAVSGGGGKGIRLAHNTAELEQMVNAARQEARASFGDSTVYLEPLVQRARHIEVQILGDGKGEVLCLGERECSIQRRRQKLIEEAPAPGISLALRHQFYDCALQLARTLNYRSLGTVEFLLDPQGKFYFIEVNPRIQVEHPVTEMVTGIDLVAAQFRLAETGSIGYAQEAVQIHGSAIEARILAEDPNDGFLPASGEITHLSCPAGPGVRFDSHLYLGMPITTHYDSLIAKVIAWGEDRSRAICRLHRALDELQVGGVPTTLSFLTQIVNSRSFVSGRTDTTYLDHFQPAPPDPGDTLEIEAALAAALVADHEAQKPRQTPAAETSMWRLAAWKEQMRG